MCGACTWTEAYATTPGRYACRASGDKRLHEALLNKTLTMPPLAEARQKELLTIGVRLSATLCMDWRHAR